MARHKSAYIFIHNLPRLSPDDQYIITCCCRCKSDSVALLKNIAGDGWYWCMQTCVVTLYVRNVPAGIPRMYGVRGRNQFIASLPRPMTSHLNLSSIATL